MLSGTMKLIPSWEAASYTATREFPNILCNPKVNYHVKKSPQLVSILSQINVIHPSYLPKIGPDIIILDNFYREILYLIILYFCALM
jgi:hypothetical protein